MKSSTGSHFVALDHVRAVAAFLVYSWHFVHGWGGTPVAFEYIPAWFPLAVLEEGHTGVALFMTLSGYLFAKLLEGRKIHFGAFLWNRALRLFPLLAVVILLAGLQRYFNGQSLAEYGWSIFKGPVFPTLPNGAWSITVELHFYLLLPLFLWMLRRSRLLPLVLVLLAIGLRWMLYTRGVFLRPLAYETLLGRLDQFLLGMVLCQFRTAFARRHFLALATFISFALFYWCFDCRGGGHAAPGWFWIFVPTIEGCAYAIVIAWYDSSFSPRTTGFSGCLGWLGERSYSIYLLHFFVVFWAARFVDRSIMDLSNFYVASLWAVVGFSLMAIPAALSFRFIEAPFLRLRKPYFRGALPKEAAVLAGRASSSG